MCYLSEMLITLTTDFGWESEGIGVMKGVIITLAPRARIVDLCHSVHPFSIANGARALEAARYFPQGIHIAVVDPTVGTDRRALAMLTRQGSILLGPDNGVLLNAAAALGGCERAVQLSARMESSAHVFDGRDVFAYSAGLLASGKTPLDSLGRTIPIEAIEPSPLVDVSLGKDAQIVQVVHVNRFGSAILNVRACSEHVDSACIARVSSASRQIDVPIVKSFACLPEQAVSMCDDGYGRYCIAVNRGSASRLFQIAVGSELTLHRRRT